MPGRPPFAVGGLSARVQRDLYFRRATLQTATINAQEWVPPDSAVPFIGWHRVIFWNMQYAINANGCAKNTRARLYRNTTLIIDFNGGECGDSSAGNVCNGKVYTGGAREGGLFTFRIIETNCGSRVYSTASRFILAGSQYPPLERTMRLNPFDGPASSGADSWTPQFSWPFSP